MSSMRFTPVPPGRGLTRGSTRTDSLSPDSNPAARRTTSLGPPKPRWAAAPLVSTARPDTSQDDGGVSPKREPDKRVISLAQASSVHSHAGSGTGSRIALGLR
ncbi:hypothetical protein NDU88_009187 [Pleurodeles waltl]|uniref:Uncharacterized protein n=1 Tax=Pleurodeles waltl TaxID=8319 RepID=A0AAV7S0B0_PLEWA|nr:hypothetical protein NDU88_009187 [Pleurodeles waltl]